MTKTPLALLLCLGLAGPGLASESPPEVPDRTLQLGADVWPPFTDFPGRRRIAIDLVHEALRRAGVDGSTNVMDDFELVLGELRRGGLDGSPALWRDPTREEFLVFSEPYLENRLVLLARRGADARAKSLADLRGKRVALVEGYAYGPEIRDAEGPILLFGRSDQENLERLLKGEVDYVLADEVLIHSLFERYGERAKALLSVGSTPIVERSLHFAMRRDLPDAESIVQKFEEAIATMVVDGSYNRALGVAWIRADVDGDGKPELVLGGQHAGEKAPEKGYDVFTRSGMPIEGSGYVVDGKVYHQWTDIPEQRRVESPLEQERTDDMPEPAFNVLRF